MESEHPSFDAVVAAWEGAGRIGAAVAAFLRRPAAHDFLDELVSETGLASETALGLFLAALRYVDGRGSDPELPSAVELPVGAVDLELILLRHGPELFRLCRARRLQESDPARALAAHEVLAERFGSTRLAVVEPGAAVGLLGRVLCSPRAALDPAQAFLSPAQQRPRLLAEVAVYRGFDALPPDDDWVLACCRTRSERARLGRLLEALPLGPDCTVETARARDFPDIPGVKALDACCGPSAADPLVPVLLTSFVLSALPAEARDGFSARVAAWAAERGGCWVDIDHAALPHGGSEVRLAMDGVRRVVFPDPACRSWARV